MDSYFINLLAKVFLLVKDEALKNAGKGISIEPKELRRLDHRSRIVLGLLEKGPDKCARHCAGAWSFK